MPAFIDLSGQVFGRLTVVSRAGSGCNGVTWNCSCECGNSCVAAGRHMKREVGSTKSCGCLKREQLRKQRVFKPAHAPGEIGFNGVLCQYKGDARRRELTFELSDQDVRYLTKKDCYYCGDPPSTVKTSSAHASADARSHGAYTYNGIDRVVNETGYVLSNCVPCCSICNRMKMAMSEDDFVDKARKIAKMFPIG